MDKKYYTTKELAELLGVSQWFILHQMPAIPHVKLGHRTVRFDLEEVKKWLKQKEIGGTK